MLEKILTCKLVLSSSLHGIVFAEAFGVAGDQRTAGFTRFYACTSDIWPPNYHRHLPSTLY